MQFLLFFCCFVEPKFFVLFHLGLLIVFFNLNFGARFCDMFFSHQTVFTPKLLIFAHFTVVLRCYYKIYKNSRCSTFLSNFYSSTHFSAPKMCSFRFQMCSFCFQMCSFMLLLIWCDDFGASI